MLNTDLIDRANLEDLEMIRIKIRNLIKYIPKKMIQYETNFNDDILSIDWHESNLENDDLKNYREKIEFYIREHQQDTEVINKLKMNSRLSKDDVTRLEEIIWNDLGTKEQYYAEYGEKPLGEFVREIVGLDMNVAKQAFSSYLNANNLNADQIYFVNQIIEYVVRNGLLKDFTVLQEAPFTDRGSIVDVFLTYQYGLE